MKLANLHLKNFLSFKELHYHFVDYPVLIQGENLTDDSQESNGSGKSSLQAGIDFALLKYTIKEQESDLIFWGETEATVSLGVFCPIRNEMLAIKRTIKIGSSSKLEINIVKNGIEEPQSFATVVDGNKLILEWIGISKEDLQNYFILSKERYKSFFVASNTEKIAMIGRFSNSKILNGIDTLVTDDLTLYENDLKTYLTNKTSLVSKIRTLNEQISFELNRDFEQELRDQIADLNDLVELKEESIEDQRLIIKSIEEAEPENRESIKNLQKQIREKNESLEEVQKKLNELSVEPDLNKYIHIDTEISKVRESQEKTQLSKKTAKSKLDEISDILDDIEKNIKGSVTCPKCSHQFLVGDSSVDIEEEKRSKVDTEELLKKYKATYDEILEKLENLEFDLSKLDNNKKSLQKEEDELYEQKQKVRKQVKVISDDIDSLDKSLKKVEKAVEDSRNRKIAIQEEIIVKEADIERLKEKIKDTKAETIDQKRIDELRVQMRGVGSTLRDINYSIRRKKNQIFETTQWTYNFKRFNMHLANQSLKSIQGYCNKFLQDMNSDIQIRWEGMKMLADGKLKEEITSYILRNGDIKKFWSFSGGERVRMEYAVILTMQKMINATHKYGGLDFLALDEVGEGIDPKGLSLLMKSLSYINKTILITTHVTTVSLAEHILTVRKVNGISTIQS